MLARRGGWETIERRWWGAGGRQLSSVLTRSGLEALDLELALLPAVVDARLVSEAYRVELGGRCALAFDTSRAHDCGEMGAACREEASEARQDGGRRGRGEVESGWWRGGGAWCLDTKSFAGGAQRAPHAEQKVNSRAAAGVELWPVCRPCTDRSPVLRPCLSSLYGAVL